VANAPEVQRIRLQFPETPAYAAAREVEVKSVTLRLVEFVTPVPKQKLEYLKLEVWLTNTDLDVCAAPEAAEIESIPLKSPEEFILVWQGLEYGWAMGVKGGNKQTLLWRTAFANPWTQEGGGEPALLAWGNFKAVVLPKESAETFRVAGDKKNPVWEIRGPLSQEEISRLPGVTYRLGTGNWVLRHIAAQKQKHKEWDYGKVVLAKGAGMMPLFAFQSQSKKLTAEGVVQVARICPGIMRDKKFWLDDKVPR
jgi:hypothetical protein